MNWLCAAAAQQHRQQKLKTIKIPLRRWPSSSSSSVDDRLRLCHGMRTYVDHNVICSNTTIVTSYFQLNAMRIVVKHCWQLMCSGARQTVAATALPNVSAAILIVCLYRSQHASVFFRVQHASSSAPNRTQEPHDKSHARAIDDDDLQLFSVAPISA